jgi:hypothetical protein
MNRAYPRMSVRVVHVRDEQIGGATTPARDRQRANEPNFQITDSPGWLVDC